MQRPFYLIAALLVVAAVAGSFLFATQAKANSEQQLADQSTAIGTQVRATSAALSKTAQGYLQETATIAVGAAVQKTTTAVGAVAHQTATAQFDLQGTQISRSVRGTAQSDEAAHNARISNTQIYAQPTVQARNERIQQTQVAYTVRQTVLAIPTSTPLPTPTPIPTPTPVTPKINVLMEGCTTGLDAFLRRIGEATTAYVTVQNVGEVDVSLVIVTLRASDESSDHPDRQKVIQYLPVGHQMTLDLTAGTALFDATDVKVVVTTREMVFEQAGRSDCKEIDPATLDSFARVLRLVVPIPRLPIPRLPIGR